jgi:membrane protein YqaA with SNARE-associated domain
MAFQRFKELGNRLIHSKHMLWGVGLASFLESIIVPIPLEAILLPLMQARRHALIAISTVALLGCMAGATVGYAVGYFIFDAIGQQLIDLVSTPAQYEHVRQQMESKGFWFVFTVGVIPIPFQIAMLAAGATKYSYLLFITASVLSRALRYYGLALLVYLVGNQAQSLFENHKVSVSVALVLIFAAAWGLSLY